MPRKGGPNDPVAQNIRNQQNDAARPSKDEIERMARKDEQVHAQWKAVEALLARIDTGSDASTTAIVADIFGFDALSSKVGGYRGFGGNHGPGFKTRHEEAWEKPDETPDHPQAQPMPPFDYKHDMERVRRLKQEAFLKIQEVDPSDFAVASKRMAPFGNNLAVAVAYDGEVHTNGTWDKVFDDEAWRDRFGERKIEEYRMELSERLAEKRGNGD